MNIGLKATTTAALAVAVLLAACKGREVRCSVAQKTKQKFCLGKNCN